MLTDRAGCYNVREKKLIVHRLTPTVNSYGIATFSVRGEGLCFFDFLKCMNTIYREFQMTATILQHLRLHHVCFRREEKIIAFHVFSHFEHADG